MHALDWEWIVQISSNRSQRFVINGVNSYLRVLRRRFQTDKVRLCFIIIQNRSPGEELGRCRMLWRKTAALSERASLSLSLSAHSAQLLPGRGFSHRPTERPSDRPTRLLSELSAVWGGGAELRHDNTREQPSGTITNQGFLLFRSYDEKPITDCAREFIKEGALLDQNHGQRPVLNSDLHRDISRIFHEINPFI